MQTALAGAEARQQDAQERVSTTDSIIATAPMRIEDLSRELTTYC